MTGEITLRGEVLPIGGLKEKLLAAHRGGIKTVLIPEENVKDLVEIPDNIKNKLEIIPVKWIDEVLEIALERKPEPLDEARRGRLARRAAEGRQARERRGHALSRGSSHGRPARLARRPRRLRGLSVVLTLQIARCYKSASRRAAPCDAAGSPSRARRGRFPTPRALRRITQRSIREQAGNDRRHRQVRRHLEGGRAARARRDRREHQDRAEEGRRR